MMSCMRHNGESGRGGGDVVGEELMVAALSRSRESDLGAVGDASSQSLGEEATGDGGLGAEMGGWGPAARRKGLGRPTESHGSVALARCLRRSIALVTGWQPPGRGTESWVGWRLGLRFLTLYVYYACWAESNLVLSCFGCPMGWALFYILKK
jgi:hypothetical protein